MAAALFTILKVLGIVALVIIAVILVLVLLVLFVPIRYFYRFYYNDEGKEDNCHYVDISWILKILKLRIHISLSGVSFEVRVFGIRCRFLEKILHSKTKSDTYKEYDDYDELSDDDNGNEEYMNISAIFEDEEILEGLIETYEDDEISNKPNEDKDVKIEIKKSKIKRFKEGIKKVIYVLNPRNWLKLLANKIKKLASVIKNIFVKTMKLLQELLESVKLIINKISLVSDFLDRPSTMRGMEKVKEYIVLTFKHILPRKKKVIINLGFDNPADTGQVLAVAGTLYPVIGEFVEIYPNFEDKELKLDGYLKGRIRGVNVVIIIIKVIRDKAIKRLIYNLNKLKEEL